MSTSVMTC